MVVDRRVLVGVSVVLVGVFCCASNCSGCHIPYK